MGLLEDLDLPMKFFALAVIVFVLGIIAVLVEYFRWY